MDSLDNAMEEYHREEEEKRQKFLGKCLDKISDGERAYHLLVLAVCERFELDIDFIPSVAYIMVEHFVKNVDESFNEWVTKNDAPYVRPFSSLRKIFPEFKGIAKNGYEIVKLANEIYNLDLDYDFDADYVYSFSFDFNSFTPINMNEIKELKTEISFCRKYGIDCTKLEEQLMGYGLNKDQLDLI